MEIVPPTSLSKKKSSLAVLYSSGFLFAFHLALITYIESSFIATIVPEKFVGTIFTIAAIITIILLSNISNILQKLGNYVTMSALLISEILLLVGLALIKNPLLIIVIFITHLAILTLITFNLDIFLESNSVDSTTGNTRGAYITFYSAAWIIPPLAAGFILTNGDYWKIFFLGAAFIVPVIVLIHSKFHDFVDPVYDKVPFWKTLKEVWRRSSIYKIFMSDFILRFFFAWMVIYTPLYLHNHIGFEWSQIGIIFAIMLLPFVILEIPLGKLADSKLGEKELLTAGFLIMAISTASLSFITSVNIFLWATVLFITRSGASMVLAMNEIYFFKQIDATDANIISFFRNSRPLAYIIAPAIATAFLYFFEFKFIFLALGIIMLAGLRYSLTLNDTK